MKLEILVVDDDMPLLRVLALHFETEGYRVRVASGGREALALVKLRRPDVVVLDAMMPVVSGVETCRQIRELEGGAAVKIMMLTANPQTEPAARKAGADAFVTKPFSLQGLSAEVRRLTAEVTPARTE
jgi:two-component system phosphate regulon response regulator PhoB